ncbi:flavin-dependent monooxygenase-like [Bradysia coprophila]|uniref:flavin-dependent monooxygenase-like n=1 Tax=Bradysia coprophila TaxID=38358 RepID=UPI00187DA2D8|nr:flavin-dependent monooxygenase-like [Bradysia coprophila]XP_037032935.1 flavin-dependent monooxygenase-like [Bradysia coprophila]
MNSLTPLHALASNANDANSVVKIIVCGGGLGGLTFARSLFFLRDAQVSAGQSLPEISITILERDASSVEREAQGYSLSLRADKIGGGIQALERIGLLDDIRKGAAPGHRFVMANKQFVPYLEIPPGSTVPSNDPNKSPLPINIRVARKFLRNTLLDSLPADRCTVQWGAHAIEANVFSNENGKEQVSVTLASGEVLESDLLIVADGANSSIRRYLFPHERLEFAGCVAYIASTVHPDGLPKPFADGVVFGMSGEGHAVLVAPVDETKMSFSVSYRSEKKIENEFRGDRKPLTDEELEHFRTVALKHTQGYGYQSELKSFIANADPKTIRVINAQDMKPHTNSTTNPQIILIGDAAHAVSPFAGNGANMAIMDGFELAEQLLSVKHGKDLVAAVKMYDKHSIARCNRTRGMSHFNISVLHSKGLNHRCMITLFKLLGNFLVRPKTSIAVACTVVLVPVGLITGLVLWNNNK